MGTWSAKLICARVAVDPVFSVGVAADSGSLMDDPVHRVDGLHERRDLGGVRLVGDLAAPGREQHLARRTGEPEALREQVLPLLRVRAGDREGVVVLVPEHRGAAAEADEGQDPQPDDQPAVASDESAEAVQEDRHVAASPWVPRRRGTGCL